MLLAIFFLCTFRRTFCLQCQILIFYNKTSVQYKDTIKDTIKDGKYVFNKNEIEKSAYKS